MTARETNLNETDSFNLKSTQPELSQQVFLHQNASNPTQWSQITNQPMCLCVRQVSI